MSKERLEEFKKQIDFLDDSADMEDFGRFVDTIQNMYEDGEFHWIVRYLKEQAERVAELEKDIKEWKLVNEAWDEINTGLVEQNRDYRERVAQLINYIEMTDDETDRQVHKIHVILDRLLEGEE